MILVHSFNSWNESIYEQKQISSICAYFVELIESNLNVLNSVWCSVFVSVLLSCLIKRTHGTHNFYIDIIRINEKENKNDSSSSSSSGILEA